VDAAVKFKMALVDATLVIAKFVGGWNAGEIPTLVREIDELIDVFT
jgi:hypothetical protein